MGSNLRSLGKFVIQVLPEWRWLCVCMLLTTAACAQIFPAPAWVVATQADLCAAPQDGALSLETLKKGDTLILNSLGPAQWYGVKIAENRMSWVTSSAVKRIVSEKERSWLTMSVERSFGATPAKARVLFGSPRQIITKNVHEPEVRDTEEILFFSGHRAIYTNGRLTGVQLEPFSAQRLGPWRLGQDAALLDGLDTLGRCEEFKGGRTFTVEPDAVVTFFIRQGKIVGLAFGRKFLGQNLPG